MKNFFAVVAFLLSNFSFAQVDHWESVTLAGDEFSYLIPTSTLSGWYEASFEDASWATGTSGFGYGDDDDATEIETTISVYLRHTFEIVEVAEIEDLILDMDFDDGFIAYINGVEVARQLVSGDFPSFDQPADGLHEATLYQGIDPERFELDKSLLVNGSNLLAIAIHNESTTSSDMTGIPTLSLGISSSNRNYRATPDWFDEPFTLDFVSSSLPIVIIETANSVEIPDEPKIDATMWILSNDAGEQNLIENQNSSAYQDYKGNIRIEIRGSSSQILPKKQFGFTTYDDIGEKDNVKLLDMPKENDWILNGLAFDPSLIRDYLTYNLYRQMGNYTTRTKFCEVVINGEYRGLYVLQEKLKADNNRIDINKIDVDENELPQLSGGYVTKADKANGDPVAWSMDNYGGWTTEFIHDHPKPEEATIQQTAYLENLFRSLEATSRSNTKITTGFPSIIDIPTFVDYILISELSANVDAYHFSTYFHKDRNGKLRAGPIWDCNLTYGNDLFEFGFDRSKTDVWQFFDGNMGAKFWKDLFDNDLFRCYVTKRWIELTKENGVLNSQSIDSYINEIVQNIFESIEREEAKWGRIGDHEVNIAELKDFLIARNSWISNQLGTKFSACANPDIPNLKITAINYHPQTVEEYDDSDLEFVRVSNTGNTPIDLTGVYFGGTGFVYQFPHNAILKVDQELYLANESIAFKDMYGFTPYDEFSRSLDNGGQSLKMLDAFGNLIDEVTYDDENPWAEDADGKGYFLDLSDFEMDNDLPENWVATKYDSIVVSIGKAIEPIIKIFPNPFDSQILVSSKNGLRKILVYTVDGKQVYSQTEVNGEHLINLEALQSGVYFLHVEMNHGKLIRKIIKR